MTSSMAETAQSVVFSGPGKRERILRAAVDVFARTGYFTAKVSEVARAAGIADGTIYLYFASKEEILITIFREAAGNLLRQLNQQLENLEAPEARVREAIRFHLAMMGHDRALAVVFQVELRQSLKFMSLFSQQEVAEYLNLLRRIVEQGQMAGVFRTTLHPQLVAKSIFGILDELVTSWILSDKHYELGDQSDQVSDLVLGGLL